MKEEFSMAHGTRKTEQVRIEASVRQGKAKATPNQTATAIRRPSVRVVIRQQTPEQEQQFMTALDIFLSALVRQELVSEKENYE